MRWLVVDEGGHEGSVHACSVECALDQAEAVGVDLIDCIEPSDEDECDACGGINPGI